MTNTKPLNIAVLVSGSGSNLQAIIDAAKVGKLSVNIVGVISNNADAYAIERARFANIPVAILSHNPNGTRMKMATFEHHAYNQFKKWGADLVVLAGFMRIVTADFIQKSPPMINLHPSLLPYYKGLNTHERVLKSGDKQHGCSIHKVTPQLDGGQILTQAVLNVKANDNAESLKQRVHRLEHKLLPLTLDWITKGLLSADNQTLPYILQFKENDQTF